MTRAIRCLLLFVLATVTTGASAITEVVYYHNDIFGNPVAATDASGNVLWKESYAPYGGRTKQQDNGTNKLWFQAKPSDADTGLSYFGARYYDPAIGRFMAIDQVGFDEKNLHSFNRYAYGNNNPYRYIDPDGLAPYSCTVWDSGASPELRGSPATTAYENSWHGQQASNLSNGLATVGSAIGSPEIFAAAAVVKGVGVLGTLARGTTELSTMRVTIADETFFHYGEAAHAEQFAAGLRPGAFATDVGNLTGQEAKSGLSLRHVNPPNAVYRVTPPAGTLVRVNPVTRAEFGQPGGLPEFQFPRGTPPGSVSAPESIP